MRLYSGANSVGMTLGVLVGQCYFRVGVVRRIEDIPQGCSHIPTPPFRVHNTIPVFGPICLPLPPTQFRCSDLFWLVIHLPPPPTHPLFMVQCPQCTSKSGCRAVGTVHMTCRRVVFTGARSSPCGSGCMDTGGKAAMVMSPVRRRNGECGLCAHNVTERCGGVACTGGIQSLQT
jgi:hypothetical protein